MIRTKRLVRLAAAGALACTVGAGCGAALDPGEDSPAATDKPDAKAPPVPGPDGGRGGDAGPRSKSDGDDPNTCVWEGPPRIDTKTLPNCGTGASCVPNALVPKEAKGILADCPGKGGVCVPNIFLESGGSFVLPSCHTLYEAEGRCLTTAIPLVKEAADLVPQDKCLEGERCLPCFSPFDGKETGLCSLSCDKAKEPAKLAPKCCSKQGKSRGVCVPQTALAGAGGGGVGNILLDEAECKNAKAGAYVCAPQEITQLDKAPTSCKGSLPLVGSYQGVCLSDCFSSLASTIISKGDCADPDTKCAPCTNPLDGTPLGLPGCPGGGDGGIFPGGAK